VEETDVAIEINRLRQGETGAGKMREKQTVGRQQRAPMMEIREREENEKN
jgi:hypothetical protein